MIINKINLATVKSVLSPLANFTTKECTKLPNFNQSIRLVAGPSYNYHDDHGWITELIGNREVVGYGVNGLPQYADRLDFPFPAIRYKTPSSQIWALRQKEKGDWRLLSLEEKKELYRANFRQTFAEMDEPTGEWMFITGWTLILVSIGIWYFIYLRLYVYPPYPPSFGLEAQKHQLRRILNAEMNPMNGLSSKWDYKKKKWKSKPWYIPWDDPFKDDDTICLEDL